ncbi:MAG: glutaredoxin family protein [Cellvibrio sp.]|uniref:glutaredoxin family protein n=1 Tax=Cellvibrio sp. TaxID=1965322 RepID=UPI0027218821|nr:glutaredoxin family protein [Cellvibrio sp.]
MQPIYLYSTPGCHLCEMAREIISPLLDNYSLYLEEIDIADSDELIERYGVRIPVLKSPRHIDELGWPFDSEQAANFLARINV